MAWMDPLTANLLDLLFELREHPVPLTISGGFGLYLKRIRLDETRERTLFSQLSMPRATNDSMLKAFVRDPLAPSSSTPTPWKKRFTSTRRPSPSQSQGTAPTENLLRRKFTCRSRSRTS